MDLTQTVRFEEIGKLDDFHLKTGYDIQIWKWWAMLKDPVPLRCIGIDAGRFFGIADVRERNISLYSGILPAERAWIQMEIAHDFMRAFFKDNLDLTKTVLEGAAYGSFYGEANLAYVRGGFSLGARKYGPVAIVPPATIRKAITGNGRVSVPDLYGIGKHSRMCHALDALGCALYLAGLEGYRG